MLGADITGGKPVVPEDSVLRGGAYSAGTRRSAKWVRLGLHALVVTLLRGLHTARPALDLA